MRRPSQFNKDTSTSLGRSVSETQARGHSHGALLHWYIIVPHVRTSELHCEAVHLTPTLLPPLTVLHRLFRPMPLHVKPTCGVLPSHFKKSVALWESSCMHLFISSGSVAQVVPGQPVCSQSISLQSMSGQTPPSMLAISTLESTIVALDCPCQSAKPIPTAATKKSDLRIVHPPYSSKSRRRA